MDCNEYPQYENWHNNNVGNKWDCNDSYIASDELGSALHDRSSQRNVFPAAANTDQVKKANNSASD